MNRTDLIVQIFQAYYSERGKRLPTNDAGTVDQWILRDFEITRGILNTSGYLEMGEDGPSFYRHDDCTLVGGVTFCRADWIKADTAPEARKIFLQANHSQDIAGQDQVLAVSRRPVKLEGILMRYCIEFQC